MTLTLIFRTVALVMLSATVSAHPGHGEVKVLSGTVVMIEAERIQIDTFDRASLSRKRIWVIVDEKTKIQSGKTRLALSDLRQAQTVECMAETEEGKDGGTDLRALQIRLKKTK